MLLDKAVLTFHEGDTGMISFIIFGLVSIHRAGNMSVTLNATSVFVNADISAYFM